MRSLVWGVLILLGQSALASNGLIIHTAEFGVGKFHRKDNQVHAYDKSNAWVDYVLPEGANTDKALTLHNADGSYTVFYQTLEEMTAAVVQIAHQKSASVSVLNVHGHGLPGAMWFPVDASTLADSGCDDWKKAASGSDEDNYSQYYSAVSADEIRQIQMFSNFPGLMGASCTTGLNEWKQVVDRNPDFKAVLASDAQVHFLSCVVGLGKAGQQFTEGIAGLLFTKGSAARVEASMDFGLGDWSMPGGMGFWDLQSDAQVEHDNQIYVANKRDADIAQKGTIRVVSSSGANGWTSNLLGNQDVMRVGFEAELFGTTVIESDRGMLGGGEMPTHIRIPGTNVTVPLR